jgi:hypothetical protein
MPRNVRNFWITLDVDGSKKKVATGPRNRDGGFSCRVQMRSDGSILEDELVIEGRNKNGLLKLTIFIKGEAIFSRTTKV